MTDGETKHAWQKERRGLASVQILGLQVTVSFEVHFWGS